MQESERGRMSPRILVTGAAAGIGKASALRLASEGASLALIDVDGYALTAVAAEARAGATEVMQLVADVADEQAIAGATRAVQESWGGLDAAVAAAGISMSTTGDARVDQLDLAVWERLLRNNLTGTFLTCKYAVRLMLTTGSGSMVVVGSPTGLYGGAFGEHGYSASKGGCHALARAMAGELAPLGVRVNIVIPGWINTRMNAHVVADPALMVEAEQQIPLGRIGQPEEVAGIVAWLTSADASYATGGYFTVDGGQTCL
ncbi:MAG TPA: SDR family NAD(P)-dependent oxidoreductase [Solirubrobacteraceae bacterium]|nr:SDR family NAD(P)-dependent oxidoreductase [Solirubrobacteraceae bacterium]